MPKHARVKLNPLGAKPRPPPVSASPGVTAGGAHASAVTASASNHTRADAPSVTAEGAKLISRYHALLKYIAQAKADASLTADARRARIVELERELAALGGIDAYQRASLQGESSDAYAAFNASKFVLAHTAVKRLLNGGSVRLLDVGAIANHYVNVNANLTATAIDLRPQDVSVLQANLLTFRPTAFADFHIVVLSLVVNFEGDPRLRGRMLVAARDLLARDGLCFLILPLACVENSRYLDCDLLVRMMSALGCELLESPKLTAKLAIFVFQRTADARPAGETPATAFPRTLVRTGTQRNNFCIILQSTADDDAAAHAQVSAGTAALTKKKRKSGALASTALTVVAAGKRPKNV